MEKIAMATKYEAYLGDEMVGKRTTKSRTYTHAVVIDGDFKLGVAGWCGRLDLAHKLAAEMRGQAWVKEVWIVPAMEVCN
jgi:hypothetical protein